MLWGGRFIVALQALKPASVPVPTLPVRALYSRGSAPNPSEAFKGIPKPLGSVLCVGDGDDVDEDGRLVSDQAKPVSGPQVTKPGACWETAEGSAQRCSALIRAPPIPGSAAVHVASPLSLI